MINKQIATHTCEPPTNISKTVICDRLDFRRSYNKNLFLTCSLITKIVKFEADKRNWRD